MTIGRCVAAPSRAITPCERPPGGVRFTPPEPSRSGLEGDRSMSRSAGRRGSVLILVPVLASLILGLLAPAAVAAASHPAVERAKVIVTFHGPPGKAAERVIEKYGGKVDKKLALVNGLAARVPKGQLKQLAGEPGVKTVEPDVTLQAFDLEYDNAWGVRTSARRPSTPAGVRGDGVSVAVIDTGIDYIHDDPRQHPVRRRPRVPAQLQGRLRLREQRRRPDGRQRPRDARRRHPRRRAQRLPRRRRRPGRRPVRAEGPRRGRLGD